MRFRRAVVALTAVVGLAACTPEQIHLFEQVHKVDFTPTEEAALAKYTPPPVTPQRSSFGSGGCAALREALVRQGATNYEVGQAMPIARRESGDSCRLNAHNYSRRTGDDSWGPFQINYYGSLRGRTNTIGPPASNTWSYDRAAANMLKLARGSGWCHWHAPRYCAG